MSENIGKLVWYDLITTDKAASKAFYTELLGWNVNEMEMGGSVYWGLENKNEGFGGIEDAKDGQSYWVAYVEVADVDATVARAEKMGGTAVAPAFDVPSVGRLAFVADPSGAVTGVYKGETVREGWAPSKDKPGDFGWGEVCFTTSLDEAIGYYGEVFGWGKGTTMGEGDEAYTMMTLGEKPILGIMKKPEMAPCAMWTHYVNVDDVDATVERCKSLGGQLLHGETIPDMVQFAVLMDPQGAVFGVAKGME